MKINFFAENISFLLQKADLTPNALSEKLGVDSATVYRWLDPKIQSIPRSRTRVLVSQFFGIDAEKLINEKFTSDTPINIGGNVAGKPIKRVSGEPIPLMKNDWTLQIASLFDDDVGLNDANLTPCAERWLPPAPEQGINTGRLITVRASGSAMAPTIKDGDLVYVDFIFGDTPYPNELNNEDLVLAAPVGKGVGEYTTPVIRKLVYGDSEQDIWLSATNPEWPGTKLVKAYAVLGKVIAIFRQLPA